MLLFIVIALILYALYSRPHRARSQPPDLGDVGRLAGA